ncbi:hypothetical protein VZT92_009711 [Zoarces viviparus]|uniref:Myb-like domain-containing protein n=1 Tax=Zoarces viviparus TaxID=48416 RepID=A0AAW1FDN4_ZOAVI
MFRRSRFSARPNVVKAGKTPQEAPSANQEASETPKDVGESNAAAAVTDIQSVVTPSEKATAPGDGNDQNGEGTSSSAAVQRRKRFSIKPKVAPGRPSTVARTQKSHVKAVSETPIEVPVSDLDKPTTSSQTGTTVAPQRLQSPRRRRPSEESKQPKMQPKPTLIPSDSSEPSADSATNVPADSGKEFESTLDSQVKGVPSRLPDHFPPSLPDKEAIALSEKAKTLVSSKSKLSISAPALSLSRLLNDPSDLQRIAKAQKLRALLRQEMHKEKKLKKPKTRAKEFTLDPAKMTMRDLIRYLPESNPMTSSVEESALENETVVPPSPAKEVSPERAQEPVVLPKLGSPREGDEDEEEEEDDDGTLVPQVKVAEDGSLIIDEESLTVEVLRAKGPNPANDRDPIFERGSTTTYSSFRKGTYTKPWSSEETDMFFLAVSMVGTDFSMICQLFPLRARSEIKNKFKKEERENSWRVDKAFRERRKLDIEYFSKLLEKILEVHKTRKKLKSLAGKNSPKETTRKAKGTKAARNLSVVEEEDEEEQKVIAALEEEGEKENEDLCNEGGTDDAKPKKKRKRKNREDALTEEPDDKKNKTGEKSNEQDEAYIPEDSEAALPEDCPTSDMSEKTESVNEAKDAKIKPAKLSRGRGPKPLLPLGRKWGKKPPPPSTKTNDTASDKGEESVIDGGAEDQVNKDASPLSQADKRKSANDDSEEEDATVQPPRPTRYGRMPKPIKLLNYPAKEAASEATPASPGGSAASAARPKPKCTAKRGRSSKLQSSQESKKPKLVTLRASQSDYSDDEEEQQREEDVEEEEPAVCSSGKDSTAPVFVPAGLRSPRPVVSLVEETMEELDILANIPDVFGISQDALCPDASCERAQNEAGTDEPCDHQLDLLVDVIDHLPSDPTEVSEAESYNEAAQTLLTISHLAPLPQSAQNQIDIQDHETGTTLADVSETSQHLEEETASKAAVLEEDGVAPLMSATSDHGVKETSETVTIVELLNSTTDNDDISVIESTDQRTGSDMDPSSQMQSPESSKKTSPQTKKGRTSKVKPKPNLGLASRTALSKSQPGTSTVRGAEKSHTVAPELAQTTEILSSAEETFKIADWSKNMLKDDISYIEVKRTEEPSSSQKRSVGEGQSHAATSHQSASENQSHDFSEAQLEPSLEQATGHSRPTSGSTDEVLMSHVGTIESICNNQVTSDSAVTEPQTGQGSNTDSAPVQESSDHPAPCVPPVEELPVSQREESEVGSTHQRKSRFQKVKPKVNLAQTSRAVRSKPQTTKDTVEKDSNTAPNLKFHEETRAEVEAEPTCLTSPEKPDQSPCPASDLIPSSDVGTTLTATEELSTTEEKRADVGVVGQVESNAATSHQSVSENQNLTEAQFEPSREQATRATRSTSKSTDKAVMSNVGTAERSCNNLLTSDSAVTESQTGQGSNTDSAPVQESSDHPAPCVTPVEELPVSQREESEVGSTHQRKSRFQKVKPKVNLAQTSRTVRSKPQTTKDTVEKDSNTAPNPKFHEETIAEVEVEPICLSSPEKPSRPGPASDLIPLVDLGTTGTLTATEELSTTEEKKTDGEVVGQVESDAVTSHQSASENQNVSEAQFTPRREQAARDTMPILESLGEKVMANCGAAESSCNDPQLTSDSAVTEPQTGQGSNIDSAPVQENSDHPAPCVTAVEELPVSQREESEVGTTHQRKSRFQKVKPKVNLAQTSRTVRSKPQTTKDTVEKDSTTAPNPKFHEETIAEVEVEPTCLSSPEKPSRPGPASDLIPLVDLGTTGTLTATEELSTTEEKKTDDEVVGQVESDAVTSHQSASENQNVSEAQFTPRREQAARDTMPILESLDEKVMANFGAAESSCNDPQLTSDSAVTEPQTGQGSNIDSAPVQESSDHPAPCVTAVEELPVSLREESEVGTTFQSKRRRIQRVQPKPNLPQTSRTARSKPHATNAPVTPVQHADTPSSQTSRPESTDNTTAMEEAQPVPASTTPPEKRSQIKSTSTASVPEPSMELCSPHTTTEGMSSAEQQKTDAGRGLDSNSKGSEQNVPQRRPRFPKVKPNLGSSSRTTHAKLQSSDISKPPEQCHVDDSLTSQQPVDNNHAQTEQDLTGTDDQHLPSTRCSLRTEPFSSTKLGPAESEKSLDGTNEKVEAAPASQWDCKRDMSIRSTESNTQPTDDPTLPTNTQSTADPKESTQQPLPENDYEAQSPDAVQQCSEGNQTGAQNTDGNQSEPTDSPSGTAPQTRRGRLIKPKPRLARSSRPPPPRQHQNTKQAEKEGEDASVCHKLVSELRPDIPDPADGAIDQCSDQSSSPKDPGSSLGCLTQVIDNCTRDASTSNTGETPNPPSLSIVPEMLSQQEPSDPDEPFFILSLTEIPVCPLSEAVDSVPEPLPYLPVTDASVEQQSVPGQSSTAAGEGPLSVPASLEESGETGLVSVQDVGPGPAARVTQQDWIKENPVEPHESTTVHPSTLPETLENNDETEIPPVKPDGPLGTRRRGKVQVKPKTSKRKQASKTLATEHSELPGPSLQPKACDDVTEPQKGSGDHVDVEKETLTGGDHPEDSSSGAQTPRTRVTRSLNRKAKGFPPIMSETNNTAPASDSPPGKAASKGPKLRTPRAAGKRSTPAPVASTSRDVAPTRSATQPTEDTRSTSFTSSPTQAEVDVEQTSEHSRVTTPNTSLCPAEVSASQQSDSVESSSIEEPTSVSQYFLSDIFTEVEEG